MMVSYSSGEASFQKNIDAYIPNFGQYKPRRRVHFNKTEPI
jgi:hypothetical protein